MHPSRRLQDQAKVLVHEPDCKLRGVIIVRRFCELTSVCRSNHGGVGQYIEEAIPIESGFLTKDNGLGDGLHSDTKQSIRDEFHRRTGTTRSEIEILPRDRAKNRFGVIKDFLIAAAEQRERALLGSRRAAGNRNIQYADSARSA